MQKKILAGLIASALAAPLVAHADVTLYGQINMAVESTQVSDAPAKVAAANNGTKGRVVDGTSKIGFKGNEDLGNGLKAIWQVESAIRGAEQGGVDNSGNTAVFATRNTFIGLASNDFGTFQMGNYDTAYKRLTDVGLNVLKDTSADTHNSASIFSRGETRLKNSVHYTSPTWAGFQAGVSYGFDETRNVGSVDNFRQNNDRWSLAANYKIAGLQLGAGWDRLGSKASATVKTLDNTQYYKFAASYKFDFGTMIGAGYEQRRDSLANGSTARQSDWLFAASQDFGAASIKAGYGRLGQQTLAGKTVGGTEAKQWLAGVTYDLSKRTQTYFYATKITNGTGQNVNFNADTTPVVDNVAGTGLTNGEDIRAIGVGLKTVF